MTFDPTTQPNFADRWRSSDLTGPNGTLISSWTGMGGRVVSQATAANQPELQTDAQGRRVVRFNGTSSVLVHKPAALLVSRPGATFYAVFRSISYSDTAGHYVVFLSTATASNLRWTSRIDAQKTGFGGRRLDADALTTKPGATVLGTTAPRVVTAQAEYSVAKAQVYLDGALDGSYNPFLTAGNSDSTSPAVFALGGREGGLWANIDLYEVLIFEVAHTANERAQVHSYFQDTYGITMADYLPPVTVTRAASWSVRAPLTASRVASWSVAAPVTATRALLFRVAQELTVTRAASWNVLASAASVTVSRAASWSVAAAVTATRAASWNVASSLVSVTASRVASWHVRSLVTGSRPASWHVQAPVTAIRAASWAVRTGLTATRAASWSVFEAFLSITTTRSAVWNVRSARTATRIATWHVQAPVTVTRAFSWSFVVLRDLTVRFTGPFLRRVGLSGPGTRPLDVDGPHTRSVTLSGPEA